MNTEQKLEEKLEGIELVTSVTPEIMRSKMDEFVDRCVNFIQHSVDINESLDLIFPMNGSLMFMYLIQKKLPKHYHDKVNWVSAYRPDPEDKRFYRFVHSKGKFSGKPVIIDDMWDSGDSSEDISIAIAPEYSKETYAVTELDVNNYTMSKGKFPIPVLVATTKEGKPCDSAVFTFPFRERIDAWIASGFGLNCGKSSKRTARYERLAGICYAVTNLDTYMQMVSNETTRTKYEQILEGSGRICYGDDYDTMLDLLEQMDNEDLDLETRSKQLLLNLGLMLEA